MRTHEFEFKKTVKRVNRYKAISVDLTVDEAGWLLNYLSRCTYHQNSASDCVASGVAMLALSEKLKEFVERNT